jgi:hypothetical protein
MRRLKGVFPEGVAQFRGLLDAEARIACCEGSGASR